MRRERFVELVADALDGLPNYCRKRIRNVAILVEDLPPEQPVHSAGQAGRPSRLLLGVFHGIPTTRESVFNLPSGPAHIVLYQKNIEAVCSNDREIREQVRRTVIHELGHYFGMSEAQLRDV